MRIIASVSSLSTSESQVQFQEFERVMSSAGSRPPNIALPSASLATGKFSLGQSDSQNAPSETATAMASSASSFPENRATDNLSASAETPQSMTGKADLSKPPSRSLLKPPARPKPPAPAPAPAAAPLSAVVVEEPPTPQRPGPISLPSEPMQYRAIGLLKGKYIASEEQFNRGDIAAEDGTLIDAVLLGRVTSLIKKHLDLDKEHLWVVYPRTLYKDKEEGEDAEKSRSESGSEDKIPALHVQIVGVWEPETLNADTEYDNESDRPLSSIEAQDQCDQFSVRGEISKYSEEEGEITVNIVQKSKSETTKPKRPFKLLINGNLTGRTAGYFWDLKIERQGGKLTLIDGKSIAVVPPKKKPKGKKGGARRRPMSGGMGGAKPRSAAVPKPKPKTKSADDAAVDVAVSEAAKETTEA